MYPQSKNGVQSAYGQRKAKRSKVLSRLKLLASVVVLVIAAIIVYSFVQPFFSTQGSAPKPTEIPSAPEKGTADSYITTKPNGEIIGVSDGSYAFDTDSIGGKLKRDAAERWRAHDSTGAISLWNQVIAQDQTDAEARIYLEDQRIVSSGASYMTIVVGTVLTGAHGRVGGANLQGAYVVQKQYNDNGFLPAHRQVRLLIANTGSDKDGATVVANDIVKLAHSDPTIVGVMGWPLSSQTLAVLNVLSAADIPMISASGTDQLTGKAPHIFRISASAQRQTMVAIEYAEQTLRVRNVAVFVDPNDPYSQDLENDFANQFVKDGNHATTFTYTVGQKDTVTAAFNNMQSSGTTPDLIYFAGYGSDAGVLLGALPTAGPLTTIPVLGPDTLYELGGYSDIAYPALSHLRMTAFGYPDEWSALGFVTQTPRFFSDYPSIFDHGNQHPREYGFSRPDADVMAAYDGVRILLTASSMLLSTAPQTLTPVDLQNTLLKITGNEAVQGISGQISFDTDGNAKDKEVLILCVSTDKTFHLAEAYGQFLVKGTVTMQKKLTSSCT